MRKTRYRGIRHVAGDFLLNLIAYNLVRIPKLLHSSKDVARVLLWIYDAKPRGPFLITRAALRDTYDDGTLHGGRLDELRYASFDLGLLVSPVDHPDYRRAQVWYANKLRTMERKLETINDSSGFINDALSGNGEHDG
jgi:hypothetical protein